MADLPFALADPALAERLARALDPERKVARALVELGELAGRDVLLVGGCDGFLGASLAALGAEPRVAVGESAATGLPDASVDAVIGCWSDFRGPGTPEEAEAARTLRPGGRLLVVHDYGRDDVAPLLPPRPEVDRWSRRGGPFLRAGYRIRVVHARWAFESAEALREFATAAFGPLSPETVQGLHPTRAWLAYKVAIYHRMVEAGTTPTLGS